MVSFKSFISITVYSKVQRLASQARLADGKTSPSPIKLGEGATDDTTNAATTSTTTDKCF